ncbi:MAG: DUF6519 domain-containing protein [Actinobacteria bacterium]|nr:DUF6519 domain-containing protein [Actinomycetota bacterium]
MKGDFTRSTFRQFQHFRGVRMQQGRVQLDADWNEQLDIEEHLSRTETRDVIGLCGAPVHGGGFKIQSVVNHTTGPDLVMSPGRIYVDGILCEIEATPVALTAAPSGSDIEVDTLLVDGRLLEQEQWVRLRESGVSSTLAEITSITNKTLTLTFDVAAAGFSAAATAERVTTYRTQPHLPDPDPIDPDNTNYVAYLEVWQRHVTEIQDPELREPALGGPDSGPDTTTRAQTVWQLRLEEIDPLIVDPECSDFGDGWLPAGAGATAELRARSTPTPEGDECLIPPEAGYRGMEHQLYRVEIHADSSAGTATFKWSRDNGSVVYPITGIEAVGPQAKVTVSYLGRDSYFTLKDQDVVEVADDSSTLLGAANDLYRVQVDPADLTVTLDDALPGTLGQDQASHPLLRRWDHRDRAEISIAADGTIEAQEDVWLPLEAGVEVMFRSASTYNTGDYWLIPARAGIPDGVIWPTEDNSDEGAVYQSAHGIERDYCVVGILVDEDPEDCRPTFPPLTKLELLGCCRRIEVGDDIQAAIDRAIAHGGGCLCLARGTHIWSGELRIHRGRNVTLHGEPGARLLLTPDEGGTGGISVRGSQRIGLGDLFVVGGGFSWLLRLQTDETAGPSRDIHLFNLRMFNTTSDEGDRWNGAILTTGVENLMVDGCRIAARNGIMSLATVSVPGFRGEEERELSFNRVRNVTIRGTQVRYFDSGITAFVAHEWSVDNSRFEAMASPDHIAEAVGADSEAAEVLEQTFDLLTGIKADPSAARSAIESILWVDSSVTDCVLEGRSGMTAVWARGVIEKSTVSATERGIEIGWLQEALIDGNRVLVSAGPGLAFAGAFRSDIDENVIRARQGIVNVSAGRVLTYLADFLTAIADGEWGLGEVAAEAGADEIVPWWLLLEEATDLLGLRGLVDTVETALDANNSNFPLLLLLASMLHKELTGRDRFGDGPEIPIIDLVVDSNDINAVLGISLQHFLPLGGIRVQDNRVLAEREQAIVINSGPFGRNPRLLGAVAGGLIQLVQTRLPEALEQIVNAMESDVRQAVAAIVEELLLVVEKLTSGLARMLETDYRVEGNSARTSAVVIETNLYEAVVAGNHVTQEQSLGFEAVGDVLKKLKEFEATQPMVAAIVSGDPVYAESFAYTAVEALPNNAFLDISRCLPPPLDPEDPPGVNRVPPRRPRPRDPRSELPRSLGGPAIWAKSPGVNISENTVIVPPDAPVETWGWGGILVKGDEPTPELFFLLILAALLQVDLTSASFISETLIADNEVAGGYGHGIRVAEVYLPLPGEGDQAISMVSELRVTDNQIRNTGGAGVVIDETANAVGVDISGNVVRDCSFDARILELGVIDTVGGIVGSNCAFVKVHGNRVSGCGDGLVVPLFGIDFERVFQLGISDNTVVHASAAVQPRVAGTTYYSPFLNGGIKADLLLGAVSMANNDVTVVGNGIGILVAGSLDLKDWVISPVLVANIFLYLQATGGGKTTTATAGLTASLLGVRAKVTDNQVTGESNRFGYGMVVVGLSDLVLTGNSVRTLGTPSLALWANLVGEGVIGNNLADQITLGHINAGTITGNRSTLTISLGTGGAIKANNS